MDGQENYEQCFEVNVGEPEPLSAFIDVNDDTRETSFQLSGSSSYTIDINGERFDVKGNNFKTTLPTGLSVITITTDLDCQGIIEESVYLLKTYCIILTQQRERLMCMYMEKTLK